MADETLLPKISELSDIELAILLCLVASQHCIIEAEEDLLDDVEEEIRLIAATTFGLTSSTVSCSEDLDDFVQNSLIPSEDEEEGGITNSTPTPLGRTSFGAFSSSSRAEDLRLPNIIIARGLNYASHTIQIQVLELILNNRIFTHTGRYVAPKPFLVVALLSPGKPLAGHLNDRIYLSHYHHAADGLPLQEDGRTDASSDRASDSSVIHHVRASKAMPLPSDAPLITATDLPGLRDAADAVTMTVELRRYLHNVVVFLRRHRFVASGASPLATKHFQLLCRGIAALHGMSYVSPSLVALAARKIYRHRIRLVKPENEISMQYGSDLKAVEAALQQCGGPEGIIEDVLGAVEMPL